MEVDLDLSQDRLRDFLQSKLQQIKLQTEHLKATQLEYKKKLAPKTLPDPTITIKNLWKTVCNGKFVVCFQVTGHFDRLNVCLNCPELNYTVKTFKHLVTVTFEVAQLIMLASFELHGFLTVQVGENCLKTLQLPPVTVKLATMPQNVLATMSANLESNLVLVLPEKWNIPVPSTLEINCGLTYTQDSHYIYEDSVIVNTSSENTEVLLTVYTKSEETLLIFVHHLLSSVPGSLVLPLGFYDKKMEKLEEFSQILSKEVKSGLKVLHSSGDVRELSQLECDSDLAYFKVKKLL